MKGCLGANIRQRREALGLSQDQLASLLNYKSRSTIAKIETGENDLTQSKIEKVAEALKTTPAYLMGIDDDAGGSSRFNVFSIPGIEPPLKTKKVPRFGTIACGVPILAEENITGYDDSPEDVHCDFTLVCKGDSMINAHILDGNIVYVRQQEEVENGEIAAVQIGDEATLKRVYMQHGQLVLMPENSDYAPMVYAGENLADVRILGKAVAFLSLLK